MNDMIKETTGRMKSFWERPEGNLGLIVMAGLTVFAGIAFMSWILPLLVNTLYAMMVGGAILTIVFLAMNPSVRRLVSFLFQTTMHKLTGMVVELNPIAIMKNHVADMLKQLQEMHNSITELDGQARSIRGRIQNYQSQAKQAVAEFNHLRDKGGASQTRMAMLARQVARFREQIQKFKHMLEQVTKARHTLQKLHKVFAIGIEDKQHQIVLAEEEWEAAKSARSALSAARAVFRGANSPLYDQALEITRDAWMQQCAEIDALAELSGNLLSSLVTQDEMRVMELTNALEEYERRNADQIGKLGAIEMPALEFDDDDAEMPEGMEAMLGEEVPEEEHAEVSTRGRR